MFPDADVPVLQISMPSLHPGQLMPIGRRLAPLRDEGVLIVGSGFFTHSLSAINYDNRGSSVMSEFDDWGRRAIQAQDVDGLLASSTRPRPHACPTRAPGTSPRCSSLSARSRRTWPRSAW